jgi:ubiquinone/menaquinone biosynthesis C-methylase UbiE
MTAELSDRKRSNPPPNNSSTDNQSYFEREAYIARTPSDPRHLNPVFPKGARVICVGCGGGWEGEAAGTSRFVGVDIDEGARDFRLARNLKDEFYLASGEQLPFGDGEFTFYMARVSLMYMDIRKCFSEASRVLENDGHIWFTCHDFNHEWTHLRRSLGGFRLRDVIYRTYVILNGFLYHFFGVLIRYPLNRLRIESFQTKAGVRRGLLRAGFADVQFPRTKHGQFLVMARKRAPSAK